MKLAKYYEAVTSMALRQMEQEERRCIIANCISAERERRRKRFIVHGRYMTEIEYRKWLRSE